MKIVKQEKIGNTVTIDIEVPASVLDEAVERNFKDILSRIKIPGFRQGKAPRNLVESRVNMAEVRDQAIHDIINDCYPAVIEEAKIKPVDSPRIADLNVEEGKDLSFSISVDVYPDVKLGKYKGISIESESKEVSNSEVDAFIEDIRERFAEYLDASSRGIESEDIVLMDLSAKKDGKDVVPLTGKGINLPVGRGYISKEFDAELIGLKTGDQKKFAISMPDDHAVKEAAGKHVEFDVSIKGLKEKKLPPLDDDFSKKVSGKETIKEFREEAAKRLSGLKSARVDAGIRDQAAAKLASDMKADIPEGMIRREVELMVDELKDSLARDNLKLDDYLASIKKDIDGLKSDLKDAADKRVRAKVALRAVAEKEKIEVTDEDIDLEMVSLSRGSGDGPEEFRQKIGEGGIEFIKDYVLRRKALDLVIAAAKIKEKKEG